MLSPETARRLVALGAFIVPVLLVKITASLLGADGPRAATGVQQANGNQQHSMMAQRSSGTSGHRMANRQQLTDLDRELQGHLASLRSSETVRSPMFYAPRSVRPEQPESETEPDRLDVTITAIMTSSDGHLTVIDGALHGVGDTTPDGRWRIVTIDSKSRSVTFEHVDSGERQTREVPVAR